MGEEKSYLALLIRDYLIFNNIYDDEINNYALSDFWFEESDEFIFEVYFEDNRFGSDKTINHTFYEKDFNDLIKFMNNPKSYKKIKKFNLR